MGQRLVISISKNNNLIANAYYHWSGYSTDAANACDDIMRNINSIPECFTDLQKAVAMLVVTGAGIDTASTMIDEIKTFPRTNGRNDGIISTTEKEMEDSKKWSEADVDIDLDTETISFQVINTVSEDNNELKEIYDNDFLDNIEENCYDAPKELDITNGVICCKFKDFSLLSNLITEMYKNDKWLRYKDEYNQDHYMSLIE